MDSDSDIEVIEEINLNQNTESVICDANRSNVRETQSEITPFYFVDDESDTTESVCEEKLPELLEPEAIVNETNQSNRTAASQKPRSNAKKTRTENRSIEWNEVEFIDLEKENNDISSKKNETPKVFIIDDKEDDNLTLNETIDHLSVVRKTFRDANEYELFLSNAMSSLCRVKPHPREKSAAAAAAAAAFQPTDLTHFLMGGKKSKPFENDTSQPLKSFPCENLIVQKFCSKLQKLNKSEGNIVEESLANIEHLRKLTDDFPNHLIDFKRENDLMQFLIADLEDSSHHLAPSQIGTFNLIIKALKSSESQIRSSFDSLFDDLMKPPEIKDNPYDTIHKNRMGDIFDQTCQLLQDHFGEIEAIYYFKKKDEYLMRFKDVPKLFRINFKDLMVQHVERPKNKMLEPLERIFKGKKCGEFHEVYDQTNSWTVFLNRECHETALNQHDAKIIVMKRKGSDDLKLFYSPKKERTVVNIDPKDYFQSFMYTIFKNLYQLNDVNCHPESRVIHNRLREVFDFDKFFNEEIDWLTLLIFSLSRNVHGVEYFVQDPAEQ